MTLVSTTSTIMRFVVASVAEAKLGGLFQNSQTGIIFQQTLDNLGHPQPKTPIHCNNATAVGITNNMVQRQQLRSMEMRFFRVGDKVAQDMYKLKWHPRMENLADYQSKHHMESHHADIRPYYLHQDHSPRMLPRAPSPSTLKGCVGTLDGGYVHNVPLPTVPPLQSASLMTSKTGTQDTGYSQVTRAPTWSDLTRLLADMGRRMLPFAPVWLM
jgi:hypothetical protein